MEDTSNEKGQPEVEGKDTQPPNRADVGSSVAPEDEDRRQFLKIAMGISALLALGTVASVGKSVIDSAAPLNSAGASSPNSSTPTFPRVKVSTLSDLTVDKPVIFNYPLDNEPNILVKLGQKAQGGVGPDEDIVAFSQVCQHLGCLYAFQAAGSSPACNESYKATGPVGYCCCHGSVFDYTQGAKVLGGPAPRPEPQVQLEVDSSGNVYAVGMSPPSIFGHSTGSSDVKADLQGGNLVS